MAENVNIDKLLERLSGSRILTPLELNEIRFSGKKTVITPSRLRSVKSLHTDKQPST